MIYSLVCVMLYRRVTVDLIYRYNMYLTDWETHLVMFNTWLYGMLLLLFRQLSNVQLVMSFCNLYMCSLSFHTGQVDHWTCLGNKLSIYLYIIIDNNKDNHLYINVSCLLWSCLGLGTKLKTARSENVPVC